MIALSRYRTLSIHADSLQKEKGDPKKAANAADPASAIRQIDVHRLATEEVFTRFSTSPTVGLEDSAVQRRSKDGKNVISKPPTQYWKKALNYVFGGFNFLMWIAFIVTVVGVICPPLGLTVLIQSSLCSCPMSHLAGPTLQCSTSVWPSSW